MKLIVRIAIVLGVVVVSSAVVGFMYLYLTTAGAIVQ